MVVWYLEGMEREECGVQVCAVRVCVWKAVLKNRGSGSLGVWGEGKGKNKLTCLAFLPFPSSFSFLSITHIIPNKMSIINHLKITLSNPTIQKRNTMKLWNAE